MGVFWLWGTKFSKGKNYDKEIQDLDNEVSQIKENYARKDQQNVFTQQQQIKKLNIGGNNNQNRVFFDVFNYENKDIAAIKIVKGQNKNLLQIEANITDETATISSPGTNNRLSISNLKNPTNAKDATNKQYVDNALSNKMDKYDIDTSRINLLPYTYLGKTVYMDVSRKTNINNKTFSGGNSYPYWLFTIKVSGYFKLVGDNNLYQYENNPNVKLLFYTIPNEKYQYTATLINDFASRQFDYSYLFIEIATSRTLSEHEMIEIKSGDN